MDGREGRRVCCYALLTHQLRRRCHTIHSASMNSCAADADHDDGDVSESRVSMRR